MRMWIRWLALLLCICGGLAGTASAMQETDADAYVFCLREDAPMVLSADGGPKPIPHAEGYYTGSLAEIRAYREAGLLEGAWENGTLELLDAPAVSDPAVSEQWYLDALGIADAWAAGYDGNGVKVAVIDSGINPEHEDLNYDRISAWSVLEEDGGSAADTLGHGTLVAGILAAETDNNKGIAGLTDGVSLLMIRCFTGKTGKLDDMLEAIGYAIEQDVDVINMSVGGTGADAKAMEPLLQKAAEAGVLVVAAAGNLGTTASYYPAAFDCVTGVGSVDADGRVSSFSQHNDSVFVTAPGSAIYGLGIGGPAAYQTDRGTSFAAPMVTALAVMAKQADPELDHSGFQTLLRMSVQDAGDPGWDEYYGHGTVSASAFSEALEADYRITYEANGGTVSGTAGVTYADSYRIGSGSEAVLPSAEKAFCAFDGWYPEPSCSGSPWTAVPAGTVGDVTLYAKWTVRAVDDTVSGVSVRGVNAEQTDGEWQVLLPFGTAASELASGDFQIQFADERASCSAGPEKLPNDDSGLVWTFAVGDTVHTVRIRIASAPTPSVAEGQALQQGSAVPASLDGLTAAEPYRGHAAAWFTAPDAGALQILAEVEAGSGEASAEAGTVCYVPSAADAGKTVCLAVRAVDPEGQASPQVQVLLQVGGLPASDARLEQQEASCAPDEEPDGCTVGLRLYGNSLEEIRYGETVLEPGRDYCLEEQAEPQDGVWHCTLSHSWVASLPPGNSTLTFRFDGGRTEAGRSAQLTLTVRKDCTVRFWAGQSLFASGSTAYGGGLVFPSETPEKAGCDFTGWYTAESGGRQAAAGERVEGNLDLYARWKQQTGGGSGGGGGGGSAGGAGVQDAEERLLTIRENGRQVAYTLREGAVRLQPGSDPAESVWSQGVSTLDLQELDADGIVLTDFLRRSGGLRILLEAGSLELPEDWLQSLPDGDAVLRLQRESGTAWRLTLEIGGVSAERLPGWLVLTLSPDGEGPFRARMDGDEGDAALLSAESGEALFVRTDQTGRIVVTQDGGAPAFSDVPESEWYAPSVAAVCRLGLFEGVGPQEFRPHGTMTRGMLVTVLWRMEGAPAGSEASFADVPPDAWYYGAVAWAASAGIAEGAGDGRFRPEDPVSREQLAAFLWRYAVFCGKAPARAPEALAAYTNRNDVSGYAAEAVGSMIQAGVLQGHDGKLSPQDPAERAQVAAVLERFLQKVLLAP